ncbi:MAG: LacI family DNA-binding transcriptional regulator [Anaerolineales bacterium]|nr:LacI family DNA-binding transcriptional regulator [Anaerolineales bacterium]
MTLDSTIRDVAKQAQVSIATVSRVLNNSPAVSPETRRRVNEAMQHLDYQPNPAARRLSAGRTNTIAVVLPLFTLPSFVERLRGIHDELSGNDYDLVLYSVDTPEQRDHHLARLAHPSRADGLILVSLPPNDQQAQRFLDTKMPVVLVDAYHPDLSHVIVDDVEGGYIATQYLIGLGHRKIAYLSDFLDTPFHPSMKHRYEGYRKALAEAQIEFRPEYHLCTAHGRDTAREVTRGLLTQADPPTAIFAASDTQAVGAMDASFSLGIHIPNELSVVGYDDIRDAEYVRLTTIKQPLYESGAIGAQMLLSILASDELSPQQRKMSIELIERNTALPPIR